MPRKLVLWFVLLITGFLTGFILQYARVQRVQQELSAAEKQLMPCQSNEQWRRVSTTLRHMLAEFSEFFHVSWTGLLIHASVGTAGGLGALRTKRSG
jgi:hypothetical protein